jgi:hypothetical protein
MQMVPSFPFCFRRGAIACLGKPPLNGGELVKIHELKRREELHDEPSRDLIRRYHMIVVSSSLNSKTQIES